MEFVRQHPVCIFDNTILFYRRLYKPAQYKRNKYTSTIVLYDLSACVYLKLKVY
jgi:hypothetical protein